MRIVSGQYKGKPIAAPEGLATRPTSDRAREAVFNILEHAPWAPPLRGARVLDLFAGSGALGLEALSRGAAFCLFVETDEAARGAIRDNVEALHLFGVTRIHRRDATDLGPRPASAGPPFDLVFLDPPYAKGLGEKAMGVLGAEAWLKSGAVLVFERGDGEPDIQPAGYELIDERRYGAAKVLFLRWRGAQIGESR
ncbi:MAG: 16S rRNA (guanine(966)-N(2))-methyltransferase RsmD [Caulobacteraceae bacterium]